MISDVSIKICLTIMWMAGWLAWIVDVEGAFLNGIFSEWRKAVHESIRRKQAATQFWREARRAMEAIGMERNEADPCLFYKWMDGQLTVMLLWDRRYLSISRRIS